MNYLSKLSRSIVDCVVHILTWNSVVVGGGGGQLWRGGTAYSAVDGPSGGAITVPWMVRGTKYSAMDGPGGPLLGGTTYNSMTGQVTQTSLVRVLKLITLSHTEHSRLAAVSRSTLIISFRLASRASFPRLFQVPVTLVPTVQPFCPASLVP